MGPAEAEGVGGLPSHRFFIQHPGPPTLQHSKLVKGSGHSCRRARTAGRPLTPTHTLTLALELADDGVQVSVLGRDVAPANWHLSAAALAGRQQHPALRAPACPRAQLRPVPGGRRPRGGPRGSVPRPPASVYSPLPSPALRGRPLPRLLPLAPPRSCPRRGAERRRTAAAGGVPAAGASLPDPTGQGRGPDSSRAGRGGAGVPRRDGAGLL